MSLELYYFLLASSLTVVYGSILEWVIHNKIMHDPRYKLPYRRHTVEHHKFRKAPGRYYAKSEEDAAYHLFETSYMPVVFLLNIPYYTLWYHLGGVGGCLGATLVSLGYILTYEVFHWAMHAQTGFYFNNWAWFEFLREHHRRHHKWARINYNVVCPLADILFLTFSTRELEPEPETSSQTTPSILRHT
ncbi:MAG: hypothetical protein KC800_05360 [Candidatus Eremiobacteraeota bacterium]|nr:hypothetical protein [Candidatus Eremiobacteraeota bacterium]